MRLSAAQKSALSRGSKDRWLGAKEADVMGGAMAALERRGLAEVKVAEKPYRRCVYRLTPAGVEKRDALAGRGS